MASPLLGLIGFTDHTVLFWGVDTSRQLVSPFPIHQAGEEVGGLSQDGYDGPGRMATYGPTRRVEVKQRQVLSSDP